MKNSRQVVHVENKLTVLRTLDRYVSKINEGNDQWDWDSKLKRERGWYL